MAERTQRSNILLAFISLTAVIAVVSLYVGSPLPVFATGLHC